MGLPPDLAALLLHMWLGAIPLVAGIGAALLVNLWGRFAPRWRTRRAIARARLRPAYFARARITALRSSQPAEGRVRVRLLLAINTSAGELPALAEWLIAPEAIEQIQPGEHVDVLVLGERPRRALPNVAWASDAFARAPQAAPPPGQRAVALVRQA